MQKFFRYVLYNLMGWRAEVSISLPEKYIIALNTRMVLLYGQTLHQQVCANHVDGFFQISSFCHIL